MDNLGASPRTRTGSVDSLNIPIHYSPADDPYWTEIIAYYAHELDTDTDREEEDDAKASKNDNEDTDADSEWLPFLLDDLTRGQGKEGRAEPWPSLPSNDAITVHREAEALVKEFRGLSISGGLGQPSPGIDVSLLQKYRQESFRTDADAPEQATTDGWNDHEYGFGFEYRAERDTNRPEPPKSARAQLLRDSEAIARLLQHQNRQHASDDALPPHRPDARPFLWQTSLLQKLPPSPPPLHPPPPPVLSDPLLTNLWVRKEMQGRWTHKYQASLAAERAALKARSHRAQLAADEGEQEAVASAKRKLHRRVVADCMREALSEIDGALRSRLHEPLADIDAAAAEWKGLQCLALREHVTAAEACDEVLLRREEALASVVQDVMPDLEDRLDAVEKLLGVAGEEMRKMRTRYARLCAWDVRHAGEGERRAEMERRLGRPEALIYLLKGWEDVRMVREMAWAVVERFEDMECGLGNLAGVGMDYGRAVEGACLLAEVEAFGGSGW